MELVFEVLDAEEGGFCARDILPSEVAELRVDRYKAANMDQEYFRAQVLLKNGQDYFSMHILPLKNFSADWVYKYLRGRYPA